jgi:outer membrane lipoprotein-sorting protein
VDEIRIAFRNGNKNTIRFQKWSEKSVAADVFDFVPPKGTAVDKM